MMTSIDLCSFSIQTSGNSCFADQIVEAAAIRFDRETGTVISRYSSLMRPRNLFGFDLSNVRDVTTEEFAAAPMYSTELPKFCNFLGHPAGMTLVGHDVQRSMFFLKAKFGMFDSFDFPNGLPHPNHHVIDTMKLAKGHHPRLASYTMPTLADRFGISGEGGYRAMAEAERVRQLWMWLSRERMAG